MTCLSTVQQVLTAGVPRDRLSYKALKIIADLDPAVKEVVGFTRYAIDGSVENNTATVRIVDRGGTNMDSAKGMGGRVQAHILSHDTTTHKPAGR